jgi:hypothetical protein
MCTIVSWVSDLFDDYVILLYLYSWTCVILYDIDLSPTEYPKKADGTVEVTPERCVPKTLFHAFKQTRLLFCTMVLLAQDKQGDTDSSETVDWLTLLPVFVSLEALLSTMTHPDMTLTCALWTRLFWRYPSRLIRFFVSIRLDRPLRQGMLLMLTRSFLVVTLVTRIRLIPLCLVVIRIRPFRLRSMCLRRKLLRRTVSSIGWSRRSVSRKQTDTSLSMREVEAPASTHSKRLMILIDLGRSDRSPSRENSRGRSNSRSSKGVGFKRK